MAILEYIILCSCMLIINVQVGLSMTTSSLPTSTISPFKTYTPPESTERNENEQNEQIHADVLCYDGLCSGNVLDGYSCLNVTALNTCQPFEGEICYYTVTVSNVTVFNEVGCSNWKCTIKEDVMTTTSCCDTNKCNSENPIRIDPENDAVSVTSSTFVIVCLVVLKF